MVKATHRPLPTFPTVHFTGRAKQKRGTAIGCAAWVIQSLTLSVKIDNLYYFVGSAIVPRVSEPTARTLPSLSY